MAKEFYVGKVMTNDLITLGKQFLQRLETVHKIPITAAFWYYSSEPERWRLVIVTPLVATEGLKKVYLKLLDILDADKQNGYTLPWDCLSLTDENDLYVSLLRTLPYSDQILEERLSGVSINGHYVEDAYIYSLYPGHWSQLGEINVSVTLENTFDRDRFLEKQIPESDIRSYHTNAIVGTGAVMLSLPQDIVDKLGLRRRRTVIVSYADERKEERAVAGPLTIEISSRFMNTDCIVGPPLSDALIGQIVLEELDLIADSQRRMVYPRPESPVYPLLKLR